jgi:hypothetical protein
MLTPSEIAWLRRNKVVMLERLYARAKANHSNFWLSRVAG